MKKRFALLLTLAFLMPLVLSIGTLADTEPVIGLVNIAKDKPYTASTPYTLRTYPNDYQLIDGKELTDGDKGSSNYGTEWHGFYTGAPYFATIDLGAKATGIKKLVMEFQHLTGASIYKPLSCTFYSSDNGTDFTELGTATEVAKGGVLYDFELVLDTDASGRYFKAIIARDEGMFVFASEFEIFAEGEIVPPVPEAELIDVAFNSGCVISGDYILGVPLETDYSELLSLLRDGEGIVLKDKSGNVKTSGLLGTGDVIEKIVDETVVDTKTIVIEGDINGDGKITPIDYLLVKRGFLGTFSLENGFKRAACISNGTGITAQDYLKIKRHFLGTFDIHAKYAKLIKEFPMTFQMTSANEYKMSCTYEGKPLSLTFDKKSWGTWNIGTFSYNGKSLAGGGTDWEYVYRAGQTASHLPFSGGNHDNEQLLDIKFYDGTTDEEFNLSVGQSKQISLIKIVEKTRIRWDATDLYFCDVVRTYYVAGNKIVLDVDYDYTRDTYMGLSYTCMFPVAKTHGLYIKFNNTDGTSKTITTLKVGAADYSGPMHRNNKAASVKIWGYVDPSYTFDVQVYTIKDSCDDFKNSDKTMYWDMNTTSNKLYFSKYSSVSPTLVKAGTTMFTRSSWTFYLDSSNPILD